MAVLACFEVFASAPYCHNDKDVTTYKKNPKSNSFRMSLRFLSKRVKPSSN